MESDEHVGGSGGWTSRGAAGWRGSPVTPLKSADALGGSAAVEAARHRIAVRKAELGKKRGFIHSRVDSRTRAKARVLRAHEFSRGMASEGRGGRGTGARLIN